MRVVENSDIFPQFLGLGSNNMVNIWRTHVTGLGTEIISLCTRNVSVTPRYVTVEVLQLM